MSATEVATTNESTGLAVLSPSDDTRNSTVSVVAPSPRSSNTSSIVPTDQDVLCGRGKGIRKHPGNDLYNKFLRDNYDEYKAARKGSKVSIVKKIVSLVRENGRFLERRTKDGKWVYTDIGDERAVNKTAQALRDIRVTVERHDRPSSSSTVVEMKPILFPKTTRRPTFRERLAMLEREQRRRNGEATSDDDDDDEDEDDDNDDDKTTNGSEEEEEVSDTETEDSFPMDDSDK
mmetsp:Transcript_866/g.2002  ORF Transcript_866/g.2002 Transcript_866/m.2002 type:complete len:233 (-) Transcript_866:307-1005(-)|eukprot:CAMPEP_0116132038 /NCGR_PEP_ID=MMETSP0329-20121206/9334_1 /TAXON_ID=697910 /ORGANISM="Pseudo-nitzschia arenysensis, Strain B593" /LENGTH=232 /DNA_ID=CAMNT_0003626525 /DNA_START=295 /DNA_END=993 /DNA_ORIENTATION=-